MSPVALSGAVLAVVRAHGPCSLLDEFLLDGGGGAVPGQRGQRRGGRVAVPCVHVSRRRAPGGVRRRHARRCSGAMTSPSR